MDKEERKRVRGVPRIGIVRGTRLVEEKTLKSGEAFTLNPEGVVLCEVRDGAYHLCLTQARGEKIALSPAAGTDTSVAVIRGGWLRLGPGVKGKADFEWGGYGPVAILFQLVEVEIEPSQASSP